jgi:hypothetical protein
VLRTALLIESIFSAKSLEWGFEGGVGEVHEGETYIAITFAGHRLCVSWYFVHQAFTV